MSQYFNRLTHQKETEHHVYFSLFSHDSAACLCLPSTHQLADPCYTESQNNLVSYNIRMDIDSLRRCYSLAYRMTKHTPEELHKSIGAKTRRIFDLRCVFYFYFTKTVRPKTGIGTSWGRCPHFREYYMILSIHPSSSAYLGSWG